MEGQPAGWFADPSGQHTLRYWDGQRWTEHVHDSTPAAAVVAPAPATTKAASSRNVIRTIGGGVAAIVIGALLPWAEITAAFIGTVSKKGTEGDGVITLILALIAGAVAWKSTHGTGRKGFITGIVLGGLVIVTAVYDMVDIASRFSDVEFARVSIGIGLWITLLGGIALVVGCAMGIRERQRPVPASQ